MPKEQKDPAAASLAAKRWKKTTKAERTEFARGISQSRWANATPEERAAHGKMLANARAKKKANAKKGAKK